MEKNSLRNLAIIMDGNRRWAKSRKLEALRGHANGYSKAKEVGQWCLDRGIKNITLWAFSTENWQRSKKEINHLFKLTIQGIKDDLLFWNNLGVRIKFFGRIDDLPIELKKSMQVAEEFTKRNSKATVYIAFNYGGRAEILDAVNKIIGLIKANEAAESNIDEKTFSGYLYEPNLPEPDLIIRTSGEMRTSGFMIWQSAFSEWYFCPKLWPDFSEADLDAAIDEYGKRIKRHGK